MLCFNTIKITLQYLLPVRGVQNVAINMFRYVMFVCMTCLSTRISQQGIGAARHTWDLESSSLDTGCQLGHAAAVLTHVM